MVGTVYNNNFKSVHFYRPIGTLELINLCYTKTVLFFLSQTQNMCLCMNYNQHFNMYEYNYDCMKYNVLKNIFLFSI